MSVRRSSGLACVLIAVAAVGCGGSARSESVSGSGACVLRVDQPIALAGPWLGILGADGETELDLVPPYDVKIHVDESSAKRYERADLTVRVPTGLGRPLSRADVESSLWESGTLSLTVTCRDGGFAAEQVEARPPA